MQLFRKNLYFYVYNGELYWGRYQNLTTQRNVFAWVFRNKPMRPHRWYMVAGMCFMTIGMNPRGDAYLSFMDTEQEPNLLKNRILNPNHMYLLDRNQTLIEIDPHEAARQLTKRTFRNRLNEYQGKYFLPFHRQISCI